MIPQLCVDEKSLGMGHQYMTLVAEVAEGGSARVEYVAEDRSQDSLNGFWEALSPEQLAGVEAGAMDLWKPYRSRRWSRPRAGCPKRRRRSPMIPVTW